ncbi:MULTISPECIES: hypothetical protein [Acidiphilium]|jgi:hypothetical protein|uniref:Lipoprotein n=1 Tax=Acidiphilium cryptum (strain JF-5) TaxID=349163 RepID=A5FVL5_ACICJ|nr:MULTISPECIES: hypothetical protein [Acidiphilium]ABQ29647.1 hypothetical protein Acry_0422 [Acidiphilium cryptum JF-5]
MRRRLLVALPLLLAGCGTLPQPLLGKPGAMGARLAVPPPPVLIVPPPPDALLGNRAADAYAHDLAKALVDRNVPSIVRPARPYDWQLEATARTANATVIPGFRIIGPGHKEYGHLTGAEVSGAAWAAGDPATLRQAADAAAPGLVKQLSAINAAVQQSNPASLENRPPRVRLIRVTGAPGDGNHALKLDVSRDLPKLGVVMVDHTADADFLIDGVVKVSPANKDGKPGESDLVELDWTVRNRRGGFIGKVSQLHDLKPSEMTPYWGDVAAAAASQAALGLRQVIRNATLKHDALPKHRKTEPAPPTPAQQP